jgi:hypothetical protein
MPQIAGGEALRARLETLVKSKVNAEAETE